MAITFYIRYKQVSEYFNSYQLSRLLKNINFASLWIGWGGALGLSVVANFQVSSINYSVFFSTLFSGNRSMVCSHTGTVFMFWTRTYLDLVLCFNKLLSISYDNHQTNVDAADDHCNCQ